MTRLSDARASQQLAQQGDRHRDRRRKSSGRSRSPTARRTVAELRREEGRSTAAPTRPSRSRPREVHSGALALLLGFYGAMVALMWLTFARTGEGAFVMLVVTLVFAAFAVVPLVILRLGRRDAAAKPVSFRKYLERSMDTLTGPLTGRAALVQIIVVPALLTLCLVGIAVALALAR
jgi:type IV secretory pathway VirB2 component (pilin)